jgi:hypothetical protein
LIHLEDEQNPVISGKQLPPLVSGLQPGERPGPYSSLVITGTHRGTPHCFICETLDKPAVIVFARNPDGSLGKLAAALANAQTKHQDAGLRAWITFLHEDHTAVDAKLLKWSREHSAATLPLAVFEDVGGPPSYRLSADAEVTILCFVQQKVVANFSFRAGELTDARIDEVLKSLPELVKK